MLSPRDAALRLRTGDTWFDSTRERKSSGMMPSMPLKDPVARRRYHREYMKRYLLSPANRGLHAARVRKNSLVQRTRNKKFIKAVKIGGCTCCPESEPCCMSFHHLDPREKDVGIAAMVTRKWSVTRMIQELSKCVRLCENCHRKVHAGVLVLTKKQMKQTADQGLQRGWSNGGSRVS